MGTSFPIRTVDALDGTTVHFSQRRCSGAVFPLRSPFKLIDRMKIANADLFTIAVGEAGALSPPLPAPRGFDLTKTPFF